MIIKLVAIAVLSIACYYVGYNDGEAKAIDTILKIFEDTQEELVDQLTCLIVENAAKEVDSAPSEDLEGWDSK